MNGSSYLKMILTLLTLGVFVFGYLGVTALDRLHRSNIRLLEKLDRLPERVQVPQAAEKTTLPEKKFRRIRSPMPHFLMRKPFPAAD